MRRLLRVTVKLGLIAGVVAVAVVIGRKLMGGLGPEPGSSAAPKEWPSLVPDPVTPEAAAGTSDNGSTPTAPAEANEPTDAAES